MPPLNLKPETNWRDNAAASQRNREAYLESLKPENILAKMNKNLPLTPEEQQIITEYAKSQTEQAKQPNGYVNPSWNGPLAARSQTPELAQSQMNRGAGPVDTIIPSAATPTRTPEEIKAAPAVGGPKIETDPDGKTNYTFTEEMLGQLLMDTSKYAIMAQQMQAQSQANYGHNVLTPEQLQGTKQAAPPDDLIEKLKALK